MDVPWRVGNWLPVPAPCCLSRFRNLPVLPRRKFLPQRALPVGWKQGDRAARDQQGRHPTPAPRRVEFPHSVELRPRQTMGTTFIRRIRGLSSGQWYWVLPVSRVLQTPCRPGTRPSRPHARDPEGCGPRPQGAHCGVMGTRHRKGVVGAAPPSQPASSSGLCSETAGIPIAVPGSWLDMNLLPPHFSTFYQTCRRGLSERDTAQRWGLSQRPYC